MEETVEFDLRVRGPAGVTTLQLAVPRRPIRLPMLARVVHDVTDITVKHALDAARKEQQEISCCVGCTYCCRHFIPLSGPEAFLLADHVVALTSRQRVFDRFEGVKDQIKAAGHMGRLVELMGSDIGDTGAAGFSDVALGYLALSIPCPLLEEEMCSVYEARPVPCRHFNVTSPAEWCAGAQRQRVRVVNTPPPLAYPLARTLAKLLDRQMEMIPLPLALDWVEANAELGMQRWPGPELFTAFAEELRDPLGEAPAHRTVLGDDRVTGRDQKGGGWCGSGGGGASGEGSASAAPASSTGAADEPPPSWSSS